ncbi:MAG TPA: response regulator transcription factor [Candidatus Coprenecus stercoravium]|uniref:Response regulator transcription factor n=1 Tax=Candidatus Coprenecus stercoravium TaxID=2840735 RepID=A0A9D2GN88_9BACT|nr:response regulator transcription factor [Candidatus Coprenecus stercoravium]
MRMQKILVVDDEETICEILQFNLEIEGFEADVAYSAEQALKMDLKSYSLILLDIMMGGMSGFKMAQMLKKDPATASIPIIFCTAKDTEDNKIAGLTLGADDYISKPFSVREVVARVKSVLRRCAQQPQSQQVKPAGKADVDGESISYNGLRLDLLKHKCYIDGAEVQLTKKEMEIMTLFLRNSGRVLSREEILHNVWSDEVVVLDRTIDVNITRLRKKIGEYGKYIVTRQGYGYGFDV